MQHASAKTNRIIRTLCRATLATAIAMCLPVATAAAQSNESTSSYSIPAGDLASALDKFSTQSGIQLLYKPELVAGKKGRAVNGALSPSAALGRLLEGSGLTSERANGQTYVLKPAPPSASKPPPIKPKPAAQSPRGTGEVTQLPEILVMGNRVPSLNTDIERTRDDVQPYVVFQREVIERSGAVNIEGFLRQRLPMSTTALSNNQYVNTNGNRSQVELRGLGPGQTLILIDGRRTSQTLSGGRELLQQDLNGIPLSAVERIEVLPTTASGIYGGDATGGVVNVILRRDYRGGEVQLTWDDCFDTDCSQPRIDLSAGFHLGQNTSVMVRASQSRSNALLRQDRDFVEDYRRQGFENTPNLYLPPAGAPLGALPNVQSTDGSELVLDDGTLLGSSFTHVPAGYAGAAGDGGAALVGNAGTYDFGLANSSQNEGGRAALLNNPTVTSGGLTLRHAFTPKLDGFVDLWASNNVGHFVVNQLSDSFTLPADAPNNPFQQDLQVRVPLPTQDFSLESRSTDRRATVGLIAKLPGGWLGELDYLWSQTRSSSDLEVYHELTPEGTAALQDGTLDILRDPNADPLDLSPYLIRPGNIFGPFETTTRSPTLILGGPIGSLPGGESQLSLRLEHRDEQFAQGSFSDPGFGTQFTPAKSQSVSSAYAGITLPLFSALNARPGLRELEVQLSVRHDRYALDAASNDSIASPDQPVDRIDRKLSSTNTTVGLRWQPIEDLVLRASRGTGFLPPNVNQLVPNAPFQEPSGFYLDPRRGNTPIGEFEVRSGGSPDLVPEESKSFSAGLILAPRFLPGARLSLDYTQIKKTDNIVSLETQQVLLLEALLPGRVLRGPNLPGDPPGWAGPVTTIDTSLINSARTEVEAVDMQLDYEHENDWGRFHWFAVSTWMLHLKTQVTPATPLLDSVGYDFAPLKFKANAGLNWNRGPWTLGWVVRYYDRYRPYDVFLLDFPEFIPGMIATQGAAYIDSQSYHDLSGEYRFGDEAIRWLGGVTMQFGIRNVLNDAPARAREGYSTYGDPRLASYWVSVKKSFDF